MSDTKLYAQRDHIAQGEHFLRHLSAMTGEGLHAKSAIAAELAHRDITIARLEAERDAALRVLGALDPHLDAIVCYASTMGEHEPNRLAADARAVVAKHKENT